MQLFSSKLTTDALFRFTGLMMERAPRRSCLVLRILIDIVRNQGDSPADVMDRCVGDRDNSSADSAIRCLLALGICELINVSGQERIGETARRRIYITAYGAELLSLQPRSK